MLVPADIRFPLERANGVQIVKTAAALSGTGARTTLVVRQSDPRPDRPRSWPSSASLPHPGLRVRRLAVLHRRGSFALPRASFLARATLVALPALRRGAVVLTRDLQLADVLLRLPGAPRVVYEAHAVEALMYGERAALYGTEEKAEPAQARAAARPRGARVARGGGGGDDHRGDPRQLRRGLRRAAARARGAQRLRSARRPRVHRPARGRAGGPLRRPALSLEGRRRAGGGLRAGASRTRS